MSEGVVKNRPPLVLMVDDHEWSSRSLESILAPEGYAVLRAYTAATGLERAKLARPDMVILDPTLPDVNGIELCRQLREALGHITPIIVSASVRPTREVRLAALRAGATAVVAPPLDAEELLLQFDGFLRAKLEADRAREEGLVDPETGLYNARGLARRAEELSAQSYRRHEALACVVLVPEQSSGEPGAIAAADIRKVAEVLRQAGRISDAVGRLGENEFAVFAPATDGAGAVKLVQRLSAALHAKVKDAADIGLRAGYEAVANFREAKVEPIDLLQRARSAARKTAENGSDSRIRAFEGIRHAG